MADAEGDLLVLLLDLALLRPDATGASVLDASPADLLAQLLAFANAYTMLSSHNRLAIFAGQHDMCHLVHLGLGEDTTSSNNSAAGSVFPASSVHAKLTDLVGRCARVEALQDDAVAPPAAPSFALSGALSRALCLIHRLKHQRGGRPRSKSRVLCLVGSTDSPMQYIPVMNAIFSAQRAEVVLDAVVLTQEDSSFLQQAAHLSGGLYFKPASARGLLGCLLNHFVCDTHTRGQLEESQALGVDFRASCFCHKFVIETGFVCSVCLSIFCQTSRSCSTCGTQFITTTGTAGAAAAAAAAGRGGG